MYIFSPAHKVKKQDLRVSISWEINKLIKRVIKHTGFLSI